MGWHGSFMTGGMALGAPLAGFAIDHRGWQAGFLVVAVIGLLVAVVGAAATSGRATPAPGRPPAARAPPTPSSAAGSAAHVRAGGRG